MKKILLGIIILAAIITCKSEDEEPVMDTNFFETYYSDNILPSIKNLKIALETQQTNITNFQASKSNEDYEKLLSQWLTSAKAYSKYEIYNLGVIKKSFYNISIYNYPVNISAIEKNITDKSIYNESYFSTQSTTAKGLATLEYLLFSNQNSTEAKTLLLNDSYRIAYLAGVNQELIRLTNAIINTWENGYKDTFIAANGSICTNNAKCLSINQIINVLDVAKVTKIGKTAGFEKSNNTVPTNLQAYRSKNSLLLIQAMLAEVKDVYFNSSTNFATMVNAINTSEEISNKIAAKFSDIEQEVTTLNNTLFEAISTNPESVRSVYNNLRDLSILFSVDITSTLSVTVLPTDNDGD
ncbi:imelysin family protein [Tenacibaculum ovolyticum]|uniref:imelysin family protein n=1 Tax=Tenacibaculum ovolyticum TaxID=104270 RepID=UPI003BACC5F9